VQGEKGGYPRTIIGGWAEEGGSKVKERAETD